MSPAQRWAEVDQYFSELLSPPDAALDHALETSRRAKLPPISVSPNQGKLLMLLVRLHSAKRILEIGTLGGYSTLWLARGLPADKPGRIVTLESEPAHAAVARANFVHAGLQTVIDLRVGPAQQTLPRLVEESNPFDFIFIDADKQSYPEYLRWSLQLARPGAVLVADNVVRDGAVVDPDSPDERVRGVRRFCEQLAAEPRVTATAIQTVGSKGYDGFVLGIVESA